MRITRPIGALGSAAILTFAALVLPACGGGESSTSTPVQAAPTPTAAPAPTPTPSPSAAETALRKLPANATTIFFFDITTMRNLPGLNSVADEFASEIIGAAGGIIGSAYFDSIHSVVGYLDFSVGVISGDFQELQGPILQAGLAQAASSTEKYKETNVFEFSVEGGTSFMAFPDPTTWAITSSKEKAKAVIDQVSSGGFGDPAIAEAVRKLGPGYILIAGAPAYLDDPAKPDESTDLEGLTFQAVGFSAKGTSTSTAQFFQRFANVAQATAGAAWMQDPAGFQKELFEDFGVFNVQARQDQNVVVAQFEVPNDKLAASFSGN